MRGAFVGVGRFLVSRHGGVFMVGVVRRRSLRRRTASAVVVVIVVMIHFPIMRSRIVGGGEARDGLTGQHMRLLSRPGLNGN